MKHVVRSLVVLLPALVLALSAMAQQQEIQPVNNNVLALLLESKGMISAEELKMVNQASSPEEASTRLAHLLLEKGLINSQELTATVSPASLNSPGPHLVNAVIETTQSSSSPAAPLTPPVAPFIPAVAPVRVLPVDLPKQGGLIPDLRLGSGANLKLYGFFKASAIENTASSGGGTFGAQDWPLPLLIGGDTGPTSDPQLFLKARSTRAGALFEWVPKNSDFTITARVEADFEGDYTDVSNRNISSVRSSQFDLRMAYMRLDHNLGTLPWFAEFGQDWSLMSTSLPSLFETTGLGVAMGSLYERIPQFRTGVQFRTGDLKIQPEFAIVLPASGGSGLTTDQRLRFGDRAGVDSNQPGLESRIVFQFPLSHNWSGVAPAQVIFSGHHARMNEIIPGQALTTASSTLPSIGLNDTQLIEDASNCPASGTCTLLSIFPRGIQAGNPQNVWTAELQLPTPWVTWVTKFYRGDDLRFFFGGQLNDVWSNLGPGVDAIPGGGGSSFSGRAISFGCVGGTLDATTGAWNCAGNPVYIADLQPVGGVGGFTELSFPLSRIFHAEPGGKNAGWVLHTQYGTDRADASDARKTNGLARTDLYTASLTYRMNSWVSFINETSYIVTRAATADSKLFAGEKVTQAHTWRQEFGPIFTF
jgi:hypothetical protein